MTESPSSSKKRPVRAWLRANPRKLILGTGLLLAAGAVVWVFREDLDRESLVAFGNRLPVWVLVSTFFVLPLLGVPISLFLLLIGLRLGFAWGMGVTTTAVFFHNIVAYRLAHGLFRDRVRAWCERKGYGIPPVDPKHQAWFTAVFAAVHGPPYAAKLYLLALTDIRMRAYVWAGVPVYLVFCILPVGFGHAFNDMNVGIIIALVTVALGTVVIGRWLQRKYSTGKKAPADGS